MGAAGHQLCLAGSLAAGARCAAPPRSSRRHPCLPWLPPRHDPCLQDWREFAELARALVAAVDAGELSEADAEAQLQPITVYQSIQHAL